MESEYLPFFDSAFGLPLPSREKVKPGHRSTHTCEIPRWLTGVAAATARWNHQFSGKHFVDVTGTLSDYAFDFNWDFGDITTTVETGVRDYTLKTDFIPLIQLLKFTFQNRIKPINFFSISFVQLIFSDWSN